MHARVCGQLTFKPSAAIWRCRHPRTGGVRDNPPREVQKDEQSVRYKINQTGELWRLEGEEFQCVVAVRLLGKVWLRKVGFLY